MLTIVTGLLSSLSYATSDMFSQRVTRATSTLRVMIWVLTVGAVGVLPAALLSDGLPSGGAQWRAAAIAAVAGCLYVAAYFALLAGLRRGDLSLVTALSALQGAVAASAAVALGERVTTMVAVGLGLAIVGGSLSAFQGRARTTSGAGWALLSALIFGTIVVLYDHATALSWISMAAVSRTASFAVIVPLTLIAGRGRIPGEPLTSPLRRIVLVAGVLELVGLMLISISVKLGPLAVASVMISQFATFGVLLGLIVLRERPRPHQLVGVACTVAAVTLLSVA